MRSSPLKVAVVTASRAEYGLMTPLLRAIVDDATLQLKLLVTGTHLSAAFGLSVNEIEADGFEITRKIEYPLTTDSRIGVAKSAGLALVEVAQALHEIHPDVLVVVGDRYEMLSFAFAGYLLNIPIAHIAGGEVTEGAFDDGIRHAISKLSHLHFTSAERYRDRVVQLGENPNTVFNVGSLSLDKMEEIPTVSREILEKELSFHFGNRNALVTFHPSTLDTHNSIEQLLILLAAIEEQKDLHVLFTGSNADPEGSRLSEIMSQFASQNPQRYAYKTSLGRRRYFSALKYVDAVIGNSSSGISEAPSFKIGTINIGPRQQGRLMASSIISCDAELSSIRKAFATLYSPEFQNRLKTVTNPYGSSNSAHQILTQLKGADLPSLLRKKFYDLNPIH